MGGRRPRPVDEAEPEPVPTSRATVIHARPLADPPATWLAAADLDSELEDAVAVLNRALRAHRAAAADPYVSEVSADRALVVRIGYGSGEEVADGRFTEAREMPRSGRRVKRSMEAPEERFAALLGGREEIHPAEELVLRARADLNAGRPAEAALQCRVAIEALLELLKESTEGDRVGAHREAVAAAANEALRGPLPGEHAATLEEAVAAMEQALKRRRLGG
jgi:hypothetical protein